MKQNGKQARQEGIFAAIAALLVLFSSLIDPIISVILSLGILIGYAVYNFIKK